MEVSPSPSPASPTPVAPLTQELKDTYEALVQATVQRRLALIPARNKVTGADVGLLIMIMPCVGPDGQSNGEAQVFSLAELINVPDPSQVYPVMDLQAQPKPPAAPELLVPDPTRKKLLIPE